VPRLTDDDATRLANALSGVAGDAQAPRASRDERGSAAGADDGSAAGADDGSAAGADDGSAARLRSVFADSQSLDELGRTLTLDLASYLNRPVRCSLTQSASPVPNAWRFEAVGPRFRWWLELDAGLACAFADAMIGGDGSGHMGRGRRVRALAERVAMRMFAAIAAAAHIEAPQSATAIPPDAGPVVALAGGQCAVATERFAWQIGMRVPAAIAVEEPLRDPPLLLNTGAPAAAAIKPAPVAAAGKSPPATATDSPPAALLSSQAVADTDAVMRAALNAFRTHIEGVLRCRIAAAEPSISQLAGADVSTMPPRSLGLALTAGGDGAVVVFLNGEAVAGLSSGAVGAPIPAADPPGEVVLAAAEAIVRDALADAARTLPGIATGVHRIVRLSDSSLPARTPHHAADVAITVGGRTGELQMLVPSWMLSQVGS